MGFASLMFGCPVSARLLLIFLEALGHVRNEQRERLRDRRVRVEFGRDEQDERRQGQDAHAYLWPDGEPNFESILAGAVAELAAREEGRRHVLQSVAERLLDQTRVRRATVEEIEIGERLLCSMSQGCVPPVVDPLASQSGQARVFGFVPSEPGML